MGVLTRRACVFPHKTQTGSVVETRQTFTHVVTFGTRGIGRALVSSPTVDPDRNASLAMSLFFVETLETRARFVASIADGVLCALVGAAASHVRALFVQTEASHVVVVGLTYTHTGDVITISVTDALGVVVT